RRGICRPSPRRADRRTHARRARAVPCRAPRSRDDQFPLTREHGDRRRCIGSYSVLPREFAGRMRTVKSDAPSLTAAGVALARASFDRPAAPTGDPDAELQLARSLLADWTREPRDRREGSGFVRFLEVRTRFFDEAVVRAIDAGTHQIVILGAGYDARALRFRTPGVRFFEVDHPATQRDKRDRLHETGASTDGITFVAAD